MNESTKAAIDMINECKYLEITSVKATENLELRVVVEELVPERTFPENPERDYEPELAARIRADIEAASSLEYHSFEISFDEYISYLVTNESYGKYPEQPELFEGKLFRTFSKSYLLELAERTTYASDIHPGPEKLLHFQICGQDEIVDVVACVYPEVRVTKSRLTA